MTTTWITGVLTGAALAATATAALAADPHRHREAHVHGTARITLAADGAEVQAELISPAANLLGFEHAPATDTERRALRDLRAALERAETVLALAPEAECRQMESRVSTGLDPVHGSREDGGHDHHDDGHAGSSEAAGHADIRAAYRFRCERPGELRTVEVRLFQQFPATERVDLQYATGRTQGAVQLSADRPSARF